MAAPKGLLALTLTAQGSGVAILALPPGSSWLFVYVMIYGIAFGAVGTQRAATISDYFGRRGYGSIASATALPGYCANAGGILGAGWLFDVLGSYQMVFWGICCAHEPFRSYSRYHPVSAYVDDSEAIRRLKDLGADETGGGV
jgi:MFS family permease